jgi:hypothetical protein
MGSTLAIPRAEGAWDPLAGMESKVRHTIMQSSRTTITTDTPPGNRDALNIREPPHDLVV